MKAKAPKLGDVIRFMSRQRSCFLVHFGSGSPVCDPLKRAMTRLALVLRSFSCIAVFASLLHRGLMNFLPQNILEYRVRCEGFSSPACHGILTAHHWRWFQRPWRNWGNTIPLSRHRRDEGSGTQTRLGHSAGSELLLENSEATPATQTQASG